MGWVGCAIYQENPKPIIRIKNPCCQGNLSKKKKSTLETLTFFLLIYVPQEQSVKVQDIDEL